MNLKNGENKIQVGLIAKFRNYFFTGILVTVPILITLYVTWIIVITFIDNDNIKVAGLLPEYLNFREAFTYQIPGLGLIIVIIFVTLIGALTPGLLGRTFLGLVKKIVSKIPVVRSIYSAIKQIMETVMSTNSNSFRRGCSCSISKERIMGYWFVTGSTKGEVKELFQRIKI